jgi:hypothetical protein
MGAHVSCFLDTGKVMCQAIWDEVFFYWYVHHLGYFQKCLKVVDYGNLFGNCNLANYS